MSFQSASRVTLTASRSGTAAARVLGELLLLNLLPLLGGLTLRLTHP